MLPISYTSVMLKKKEVQVKKGGGWGADRKRQEVKREAWKEGKKERNSDAIRLASKNARKLTEPNENLPNQPTYNTIQCNCIVPGTKIVWQRPERTQQN